MRTSTGGEHVDPPITLGRYEILGKLGIGGMATVYLARNAGELGFQRMCAIKVLHPHLAEDPGFIQMLLDEAQIAARLHHPNVVPIVDLGTHEGILYVAMEYVEGCSLSALLKKSPGDRPQRLVVPIVLDMLAGLDAAHSLTDDEGNPLHLVHRDVSPQNVLIGIDGAARITDFGIARARSRITSTRPGQLKGKLAYMSPEQVRSGDVDRRSDIFSAGSMLWSLLTGRKLFVGDNDAATMHNIVDLVVPPPSTVGFQPPAAFDAVCLRALDRDPDKRFASAQAMEDALREAATAAGTLGSRREVGEWIVRTFRDELAERRKVVRAAVGGGPAQRPSAKIELPSFTPSASLNTWQPARSALGETRPAPKLTLRSRYRQLAPWAVPVIAVFALVLWLVLRSKSTPSDLPSAAIGRDTTEPPPHAPAVVQPPSAPAPAPQVVTPAPAVARAPTPAPQAHRDPPQRPALVRRLPVVPKPAPIVTVTPPPPPPPPPPRRWDPDSPEPPP